MLWRAVVDLTTVARLAGLAIGAADSVVEDEPGWARVPIRSAALAQLGLGGEGCQVVRTLGASHADPSFMLLGADVGGVYRSLSGGDEWHPAMVGWNSRGAAGFAFDGANPMHVLGLGGNSQSNSGVNGIHVSFDGAASWSFVQPVADAHSCMDGSPVTFDPTSVRPLAKGAGSAAMAMTAYYSSSDGLWQSINAGKNWSLINPYLSTACLVVDHAGRLFASSDDYRSFGFYSCGMRYDGRSGNCTRSRAEYTTGLDLAGDGQTLFISNWAGVMVSRDHGASFQLLAGHGLPKPGTTPIHHVAISPANSSYISVWWVFGPYYNTTLAVSQDGGSSFSAVAFDNTRAFMPLNGRDGKPVWHPTDASILWNIGGDWVTKSHDGGRTLTWDSNGYAVVMTGGGFSFNVHAPDVLFLAFQDYAGAITWDAGNTWAWAGGKTGISGHSYGGQAYGGFALNEDVMWAGSALGWHGPRTLKVTQDAGQSWTAVSDPKDPKNASAFATFSGPDVSAGDPNDPLIGFASNFRTTDGGGSWGTMDGCAGVMATTSSSDSNTSTLFGVSPGSIAVVMSTNKGVDWQILFHAPGPTDSKIRDLSVDWERGFIYVVSENREASMLYRCQSPINIANATSADSSEWVSKWSCASLASVLPKDQLGGFRASSVAVDPIQPTVVYASAKRDYFLASNPVVRSTDAGNSFSNMLLDTPLLPSSSAPLQGPHEVSWLRVHPTTRWLWVAGSCFGVWKAPPPSRAT
eukprot:COSAG02_NODE_975_length_15507_cov_14.829180_2_plen_747_part_00